MASSSDEYATADATTPSLRGSVEPEALATQPAPALDLEDALAGLSLKPAPAKRARVRVAIQDACRKHRFLRYPDDSAIVERPLRLRAVNLGIAAAHARLSTPVAPEPPGLVLSGDIEVVRSTARLDLASPAVTFVHSDSNEDPGAPSVGQPAYPAQLKAWTRAAAAARAAGASEIPSHLPQGDLYLCAESLDAVEGALGTTCEAIDQVMRGEADAMFVAIRPPGHHCGNASPAGFCFLNNVVVAAAHAHLQHGVDRVIIFDIDLHHGNGSQKLCEAINAEARRITLERAAQAAALDSPARSRRGRSASPEKRTSPAKASAPPRPLRVLYTSLHDVESYPCEDGDADLIAAASVRILGGHDQWTLNVHLEDYADDADFAARVYPVYRDALLDAARKFVVSTDAVPERTLIFVSAGFDASEHEYPSMQRHGKRCPTGFFARFARDARSFAQQHASDRLIAVLEGGYSDRALSTGTASLLAGLVGSDDAMAQQWDAAQMEKAPKRAGPVADAFKRLEEPRIAPVNGSSSTASTMQLRERKVKPTVETPPQAVRKARVAVVSKSVGSTPTRDLLPPVVPAPLPVIADSIPTPKFGEPTVPRSTVPKIRFTWRAGEAQGNGPPPV